MKKKILSILLVTILCLSFATLVSADNGNETEIQETEQEIFNIEDEWRVISPSQYFPGSITKDNETNCYILEFEDGSITINIHEDIAQVSLQNSEGVSSTTTYTCEQISDNVLFIYIESANSLSEYPLEGDEVLAILELEYESGSKYFAYEINIYKARLFFDGYIYEPYKSDRSYNIDPVETIQYMLSDNYLYLIQGGEYASGKIFQFDNDFFCYVNNSTDDKICGSAFGLYTFGIDGTYMFVRASKLR